MVLRPVDDPVADRTYLVVGLCYVHGLMSGEAIYRGQCSACQAMEPREGEQEALIDRYRVALHDPDTDRSRTDPAELLEEAGIRIESYQRAPHKLPVLPETLRAAGKRLVDFVLVL